MVKVSDVVLPDPRERKPAVLVVEDELLIRMLLSDYLQDCEFTVFDVANAAEAIAFLEAGEFPVDAVLTDVRMPGGMDGFGLARWIRENRPGLPVLITTGDKTKTEAATELCEQNPIISKPHDLKLVAARIRAVIDAAAKEAR
jgi:CheY-like chemotaxis protein